MGGARKFRQATIGFGGLYDDPLEVGWGIEVGYHFAKTAWGSGYATELTEFCLRVAHERLGFDEIRAFAHPDNVASQRSSWKRLALNDNASCFRS